MVQGEKAMFIKKAEKLAEIGLVGIFVTAFMPIWKMSIRIAICLPMGRG